MSSFNDPTFLSVPPPPAPRRRVRPWMIGASSILLVCCVAFLIFAYIGSKDTPTPTARATSTPHPTSAPTRAAASPTPIAPRLLSGATLGGLADAFTVKYGNPTGNGTAKSYTFTLNDLPGIVTTTPNGDASSDGKQHVASLRIGPQSGGNWNVSAAQTICSTFLPPDAVFVKTQTVDGFGPERVYQSAALALTFPSDGAVFSMELWPGVSGNHGCILVLGS